MRALPIRKAEVNAVAALLENEAESVTALAESVIRTIDALRADRDQFAIRINLPGLIGMGPFRTENQALEAARIMGPDLDDDTLKGAIFRLTTPRLLEPEEMEIRGGICPECGHPNIAHNWPKIPVTGCIVGYKAGKPKSGCLCGR